MKPESGQQLNFILLQISQPYQTLMSWEWRKQSPRKSVFIYLFCSLTAQRKHGKQRMLMLTTGVLIEPFQKLETCCTIILCSKHLAAFFTKKLGDAYSLHISLPMTQQKALGTSWSRNGFQRNVPKHETYVQSCCSGYETNRFWPSWCCHHCCCLRCEYPPPSPTPIALLQAALDLKPSSVV